MLKILTIILSFTSLYGHAADSFKATMVRGKVEFRSKSSGDGTAVQIGTLLNEGDRIKTGKKSLVRIKNSSLNLMITAKSYMKISNIGTDDIDSTVVTMAKGFLWGHLQKKSKNKNFKVITKNAAMGVRGTKFSVSYGPTGTLGCVCDGSVRVFPKGGEKIIVKRGEGIVVNQDLTTHPKQYAKTMKWGKPNAVFGKWLKKDARYQSCTECHNAKFKMRHD